MFVFQGFLCYWSCWFDFTNGLAGFDRDLGIAGRAMVRTSDGSIVQKLLKIDRPSMVL